MTKKYRLGHSCTEQKTKMITLKNAVAATLKPDSFVANFHTYDLFHDFDTNRGMRIPAISLFWATKLSIRSPLRILYPDFSPNHQNLLHTEKMQYPKLFRNLHITMPEILPGLLRYVMARLGKIERLPFTDTRCFSYVLITSHEKSQMGFV